MSITTYILLAAASVVPALVTSVGSVSEKKICSLSH